MLLELSEVTKRYRAGGPPVVDHVNLTLDAGETLAVFGDSGSGKSTIGQIVAGILPASSGQISFQGREVRYPLRGEVRRSIQILFQHPEVSFNPKMKLIDSLREPYRFYRLPYSRQGLIEYLAPFGIYAEHLDRTPAQLSGGELQRMALARVLLVEPQLIVLDEPTSMLDAISQAQVIGLLQRVQRERRIAYLFISHDRALCGRFCHRLLRLEDGRLREEAL